MLQLLSDTQYTIRELQHIQNKQSSSGNLIDGLAHALGAIILTAGEAGSKLIKAIGTATKDCFTGASDLEGKLITSIGDRFSTIIKSTETAIKDVSTGLGNVFS